MDIADFLDNFKYKLIVPGVYVISWILMFVGPFFFQVQYQLLCIALLIWLCGRSLLMLTIGAIACYKANSVISKAERLKTELPDTYSPRRNEIIHAFIIPSYKEDEELLEDTLERLAVHPQAKERYLVFMGMEFHEEDSDLKAEKLIKKFEERFRLMGYTRHHIRQYEQKGKASNVSWCVEHIEDGYLLPNKIDPEQVQLTIIDADSWVPAIWTEEIEEHMVEDDHWEKRHKYIYQTNQIFTRNHLDVPIFSRTYDQLHAGTHHSNMLSIAGITFPLSNYSLSYALAKRIGFWDTCADAIGEDFHTTIKAFWKTGGDIECIPIYASFNQVNVETGKGYLADVEARFWQAERHARGVASFAYCVNQIVKSPWDWRSMYISYFCFECAFVPASVPWVFLAMTYQSNILFKYTKASPELISEHYVGYLFNIATFCFYGTYFLYYAVKRRATSALYGLENESILRVLEYPLIFMVNMILINIPTFIIATFGVLIEGREYVVAEKAISRK